MNYTYTNKPIPFSNVLRALELKLFYDENISQVYVPSKRKQLTVDNAEWFVNHASAINTPNNHFNFLMKICQEYIDLASIKYKEDINVA